MFGITNATSTIVKPRQRARSMFDSWGRRNKELQAVVREYNRHRRSGQGWPYTLAEYFTWHKRARRTTIKYKIIEADYV